MPKTIRIKARQSMVNYRKPASLSIRETYPLPPYSTVLGMVHGICGFKEYHPMKVSVQGRCRGIVSDLFARYSFGNKKYEKDRHHIKIPEGDTFLGVFRGLGHTELHCNVELVLHLDVADSDFDAVWTGLHCPRVYPSLGRYEDLLDIEEIAEVHVAKRDNVETPCDIYVPLPLLEESQNAEGIEGTVYRLSKEYELDKKTGIRRWKESVAARCVSSHNILYDFWADDDQNPVAMA